MVAFKITPLYNWQEAVMESAISLAGSRSKYEGSFNQFLEVGCNDESSSIPRSPGLLA